MSKIQFKIDFQLLSVRIFLYNQNTITKINITRIIAKIGAKIEAVETTTDVAVSVVETTGLPIPAVAALDVSLVADEALFIAPAVPPPAIIASDQVIKGSKLATVDTTTAVPAMAAKGTATVSNKLSIKGM